MKLCRLIILLLPMMVVGCVTTNTGDMPPTASKQEAAELNMDLGISYLRQGDFEEAMVKLEKSIAEEPKNPTAHRALAHVFEILGDDVGAEKEYRIAVRQAGDDADALNDLAVFLCRHGDEREAMPLFDRAAEVPLYQSKHMIYTNAGTCAKEFNLLEAEDYLRQALMLKPSYSEALYQMGDVAYLQENYLQARAFIDRYVAISTSSTPDALWLGYRVETALSNPKAAATYADQLLNKFPGSVEARMLVEERRNAG